MDISTPYYSDFSRISNSNIGWFLNKGPAFLHKMLTDPPEEEKNSTLERGTMIHEYILQPEEFQKDYVVWDKPKPSSTQQEKFCQELAFTTEIEPNRAVLSAYKQAYSTKGKTDDLMLSEGLKIASSLSDYIDFLKSRDERKMISVWDVKMLEKIKQNIQSHKLAWDIIWPLGYYNIGPTLTGYHDENIDKKAHHEFHINWEYYYLMPTDATIQCKSLLDGLTLDFKNKKAIIYDLKTTQKLWHFEDSIQQYDYCRQLMYYTMAVQWYLKNECNEDPKDWSHVWYIIGIDTTGSNEIRVFKFTEDQIYSHADTIEHALADIAWHQSTGKWEHSRSYYEGDGSESLNL